MIKLSAHLEQLLSETLYLPLRQGRASALSFGEGPVVLCLHGFPDNYLTYRFQVEPLVRAGYRVVLPVMRGYEPGSVQSDGRYYIADLAEDTVRWVDQLNKEKVHLVGHDWGGVTAWASVGLAPGRFHTVTSLAIPHLKHFGRGVLQHPGQLLYSWYMNFFQLRGLSDWAVSAGDWQFIRWLWQRWSPDWECPEDIMAAVTETFAQPGVKQAALGYYRCMFKALTARGRDTLALLQRPVEVPALLITGANDGCMRTELFESTLEKRDFPAGVAIQRIAGAGHFVHLEAPETVSALLLDHLENAPE
ncbi:MAG: alpha/beta fold hydrolase [Ketobacteraceae bacterium]|nr:alpha/beta fold hydrolase [Ketobacteraceae bacterium]